MSSLKGITPLLASSKQILSEKKHAATKNLHLAPASVGLEAIFFLKLFFFGGGSYVDPCPKVDANLLIFNELSGPVDEGGCPSVLCMTCSKILPFLTPDFFLR